MKRTKSHKLSLFLFYFYFLVQALSSPEEILNKYSSIKTTNNYAIVNITDFNYNDNIYLSLKSYSSCEEYIEYQFYDSIEDIFNDTTDIKFNGRPYYIYKNNMFDPKNKTILFFGIAKRKEILSKLKGNYLSLIFCCKGEVEIINTKERKENLRLILLCYYSVGMLGIFLFIIIEGAIYSFIITMKKKSYEAKKKAKKNINMDNITKNFKNSENINNINYPKERIVYIFQGQRIININKNNYNNINDNYEIKGDNYYIKNSINNLDNSCNKNINYYTIPVDLQDFSQNQNQEISQRSNLSNSTINNFSNP